MAQRYVFFLKVGYFFLYDQKEAGKQTCTVVGTFILF